MADKKVTAHIVDVPVFELSRPLDNSMMRANYLDVLLEVIVETAESVEHSKDVVLQGAISSMERIRVLTEIAQMINSGIVDELAGGDRFLRENQKMRMAA